MIIETFSDLPRQLRDKKLNVILNYVTVSESFIELGLRKHKFGVSEFIKKYKLSQELTEKYSKRISNILDEEDSEDNLFYKHFTIPYGYPGINIHKFLKYYRPLTKKNLEPYLKEISHKYVIDLLYYYGYEKEWTCLSRHFLVKIGFNKDYKIDNTLLINLTNYELHFIVKHFTIPDECFDTLFSVISYDEIGITVSRHQKVPEHIRNKYYKNDMGTLKKYQPDLIITKYGTIIPFVYLYGRSVLSNKNIVPINLWAENELEKLFATKKQNYREEFENHLHRMVIIIKFSLEFIKKIS